MKLRVISGGADTAALLRAVREAIATLDRAGAKPVAILVEDEVFEKLKPAADGSRREVRLAEGRVGVHLMIDEVEVLPLENVFPSTEGQPPIGGGG